MGNVDTIGRWYRITPDRLASAILVIDAFLLLSERFDWFILGQRKGWPVLIAVVGVAAFIVVMLLWLIAALIFRRRFQFCIRSLLVLVVVVAVPCGWLTTELCQANKQHDIVEWLRDAAFYDFEDYCRGTWGHTEEMQTTPKWLRDLLGVDFFANVAAVDFLYSDIDPKLVGGVALERVKALPLLRSLTICCPYRHFSMEVWNDENLADGCGDVTSDDLEHLESLTQLVEFNLLLPKVTGAGLEHLKSLHNLRTLSLDNTKVADAGLEPLQSLGNLQELSLDNTRITDAGLKHLQGLSNLRKLSLRGTRVTDAGLDRLKGLGAIEELVLDGTRVTDAGLKCLRGMTRLRVLSLWETAITDAGMEHLQCLSNLRELILSQTHISDRGLECIKGLGRLRSLVLLETKITDVGIEQLKGMPQLEHLDVADTAVSDAGAEKLREALPNCEVVTRRQPGSPPLQYPGRRDLGGSEGGKPSGERGTGMGVF